MCLAIPGKVIRIENGEAVIDYGLGDEPVKANILEECKVGDYVIVQAKMVIQKVPKDEALKTLELVRKTENGC